jgi:hypothetical protein
LLPGSCRATRFNWSPIRSSRRPCGSSRRLYGSPCLGRGILAGSGLDRTRCNQWVTLWRGAHPRWPVRRSRPRLLRSPGATNSRIRAMAPSPSVTFVSRCRLRESRIDPGQRDPTREPQWTAILACGEKIDDILNEHERSTDLGGEPTFVSIDDMDVRSGTPRHLGRPKPN